MSSSKVMGIVLRNAETLIKGFDKAVEAVYIKGHNFYEYYLHHDN